MSGITYKLSKRGLFSELHSLIAFYENELYKDFLIYVDGSRSQYFKHQSVNNIFKFNSRFVKGPFLITNNETINSNGWRKGKKWKPQTSKRELSELFSYSNEVNQAIDFNIKQLKLPEVFFCFHIRRGDKVGEARYYWTEKAGRTESKRYEFEDYLKKINFNSNEQTTIFVMTDDYKAINEGSAFLKENDLKYKLVYLTNETQLGHSTDEQIENKYSYNENELIQLLTEVEVAKKAKCFVGTRSSNVFRFIEETCTSHTEFMSLD